MNIDALFIQPNWPAPKHVKAFTSLRQSEVGIHQDIRDNAAKVGNINRQRLQQLLQLPSEPIWLTQVHSNLSIEATPEHLGQEADGSFTTQLNRVCAVLTADCLPVMLTDRHGTYVAAIHAGWRGLAKGIIENTIKKSPVPPQELLVWLGPAIGPRQFEVRKDVYDAFIAHDPEAKAAFHPINSEQWLADLYLLARQRLAKMGVSAIFGGEYCTHSDSERFYSYRHEKPQNGRQGSIVSLIWLAPIK